jgi:hypothetical protein
MCDFDPPELYTEHHRTARKAHRCCECGKTIQRGESHRQVRGKWCGDWWDARTCSHCLAVEAAYLRTGPHACVLHGGLYEIISDSVDRSMPGWFAVCRAVVLAKRARAET